MRSLCIVGLIAMLGCGGGSQPAPLANTSNNTPPPASTPATTVVENDGTGEAPPTGQLPDGVTPTYYQLALTIVPDRERFFGQAAIKIQLDAPRRVIWMHGRDLNVTEIVVEVDGQRRDAAWQQVDEEGVAAVRVAEPVGPGEAILHFKYDAPFDRALKGLYRVDNAGESYAFTQFEAISARLAFPGFDEPRFKTPFDVILTVKKEHAAIANTLVEEESDWGEDMKRIKYTTTEPLPTYLVAWAVGPLDVVEAEPIAANSVRRRPLPFRGIAVKGKGPQLAYALKNTPAQVKWLEEYFGSEYVYDKLDIVAVPDFGAGAMENAGLITFREWLLLLDEDSAQEGQKRAFAAVMAHELAHQWFGNLVTMPWWDDIWLNEAFATWMGNKVLRNLNPDFAAEISMLERVQRAMRSDSLTSARQIRQPIETNHDIRNAFDSITYSKGGGVLEMFERWLTPDTFRDSLRHYMNAHRFGTATYADLLASLSEVSGRDVTTPFSTFLFQPGVPQLAVSLSCENNENKLRIQQSRYFPVGSTGERSSSWKMPLCVRYGVNGDAQDTCTLLTEADSSIDLASGECPTWVMPNADGAGYMRFSMAAEDLAKLRDNGWKHLTPRERMATVDSLQAAFFAGTIPAEQVFPWLETFADDDVRQVRYAPADLLNFAAYRVADDELRRKVRKFGQQLYKHDYRRLRWAPRRGARESGETKLKREALLSYLAFGARHPRVRSEGARRGRAFVGYEGDGRLHRDAVPPEIAGDALGIAVQDGDEALFNALLERLFASEDSVVRNEILGALGRTQDPTLSARARSLALDARIRLNEMNRTLRAQMSMQETRQATWEWLQQNFDTLLERVSPLRGGYMPWLTSNFCSVEKATEVESFFASRIEALPGGPRNLAGALEAIRLCASVVEAQGPSVHAFFASQR